MLTVTLTGYCTLGIMTDKPSKATASAMLPPLRVLSAGPPHTYVGIAGAMLEGVKVLAASPHPLALPLALLAAHVLECTLKAYLSRDGDDSRVRQADIRHNLGALWSLAHAEGLSIPSGPPQWVSMLSHLHKAPYYLRYSTGVHGISSPAAQPMTAELNALFGQVSSRL